MSSQANVLFDTPGPARASAQQHPDPARDGRAARRSSTSSYARFDAKGQWDGTIWKPFLEGTTWVDYIIPGLLGTLKAAGLSAILALVFGVIFGLARLSDHRWIRVPAGAVVEVFRAIPLLLLIFFIFYLCAQPSRGPATTP